MRARENINRKIKEKKVEIESLKRKLDEATVFLHALEEALGCLPTLHVKEARLRAGSLISKVRAILQQHGPMHVDEIIRHLGLENEHNKTKLTLTGAISQYVRRKEIFARTDPNTFGIIEEFPDLEAINQTIMTSPSAL